MKADEALGALNETLNDQEKNLKLTSISHVVRRDCALLIFQAIIDFLKCWPKQRQQDIPRTTIRQGLETVLSELGPHDDQLYTILLDCLPITPNGRDLLFDILPYCVPIEDSKRNETTNKLLGVLREVLLQDASSLVPIIGALSSTILSQDGRQEVWKLAFLSLEALEDSDYPPVIQTLLRNVTNNTEAVQAWDVLRQLNTGDENLIVPLILNSFQSRDNGRILAETYVKLLLNMVKSGEREKFLGLDVLVVLELLEQENFKSKLESLIDTLVKQKRFPFDKLLEQVEILYARERSVLQERLQSSLLKLSLFLLLSPIRINSGTPSIMMSQIHEFILILYYRIDRIRQEELIRSLLHLGDEVSMVKLCHKQKYRTHHLDATFQSVHTVITSLAANNPASVLRFKSMLLQRLTSNNKSSGYEQIISILVNLVDRGTGDGIDSTEVMVLLQKLLFCSSGQQRDRLSQQKSQDDVEKVARGLLLATYMVQAPAFSNQDKECMHQWVKNILLPTNRRTVIARVGSNGLDFLSKWSKQGGQTGVFQHIKMMLANTGLIQSKESYQYKNKVVFGYEETPFCFLRKGDSEFAMKKKRLFLFCVDSYLQYKIVTNPSDWEDEVFWVFRLVDMYLEEGRLHRKSKWQPDGWLEALLELPLILDEDSAKNKIFNNFNVDISNNGLTNQSEIRSQISLAKDNFFARKLQVEDLLRLLLGLLLSSSLSAAVLRNGFSHLNSMITMQSEPGMNNQRKILITNLLKYQFLKLYDLKRRIEILSSLLKSIANSLRRPSKSDAGSHGLIDHIDLLEEASKRAKTIVDFKLLFNLRCLPFDVLKTCLIDELDDQCLLENNGTNDQFNMIISLRSKLLQHSAASYRSTSTKNDSFLDPQVVVHSVSFVSKLFDTTNLNKENNGSQVNFELIPIMSSYLGYITCVVNSIVQELNSKPDESATMLRHLIQKKEGLGTRDQSSLALILFEQFTQLLPKSYDFIIALQVLEILSLLARFDPITLASQAVDACWRMMHTIYVTADQVETPLVSFAFKLITNRILNSNIDLVARKVLRLSIINYSARRFSGPRRHSAIRESLLLLWSQLVITSADSRNEKDILSGLVDDLQAYIEMPSKAYILLDKKDESKKSKDKNKKPSGTMRGPKIQFLDGGSLLIYIELTIHMVIATFAMIEPSRITQSADTSLGPFSHLKDFPLLFERLLLLVDRIITILPKRFISLTFAACHQMLQLSVLKARECVDWRQSQPLLSSLERREGKRDNASIMYLEALLQRLGMSCVGVIVDFCHRARNRSTKSHEAKEEELDPFAANDRKLVALLMASERTLEVLRTIATHHNIVLPTYHSSTAKIEEQKSFGGVKLSSRKVKGYHHADKGSDFDDQPIRVKKKRRVPALAPPACQENEPDEEYEWEDLSQKNGEANSDDSSTTTEYSFCANWGSTGEEDDKESDETSVSGYSLELEGGGVNSLTKAT